MLKCWWQWSCCAWDEHVSQVVLPLSLLSSTGDGMGVCSVNAIRVRMWPLCVLADCLTANWASPLASIHLLGPR